MFHIAALKSLCPLFLSGDQSCSLVWCSPSRGVAVGLFCGVVIEQTDWSFCLRIHSCTHKYKKKPDTQMKLNTWLYFGACAWGNENTDLDNVSLWCMYGVCMYVFIWRVCLGRVQKVSSYDLKCLQELLPLLKATVSKSLVTFFVINAKVMILPSLRTKQFSRSRFHTPVLWSVLSWKETL